MRVFPHRDRHQDSDPKSRPRLRPIARPRLERLECRILLSGTDPLRDAGAAADVAIASRNVADSDSSSGLAILPTKGQVNVQNAEPAATVSSPPFTISSTAVTAPTKPPVWVIDAVHLHSETTPALLSSISRISLTEIAELHSTIQTAQILPQADAVEVQGTSAAGEPADMYRMPINPRTGSIIVSFADSGTVFHGEKHIQIVDEDGDPYDLKLPGPSETLTILIHERYPSAGRTLYLAVFTTPNPASTSTEAPSGGDPYALTVTQQPLVSPPVTSDLYGQVGQATETVNYATTSIGSSSSSMLRDSLPPGESSTRFGSSTDESEAIELENVAAQASALSLPTRVVSPEAGILSMDDETTSFIPSALAIDLALFDLDAPEESADPITGDSQNSWAAEFSRPSGSLPLTMVSGFGSVRLSPIAANHDETTPLRPSTDAPPPEIQVISASSRSKGTKRWNLLQAGVGIASALAYACLMPDATLMFQKPARPRRPIKRTLPDADDADPAEDCGR